MINDIKEKLMEIDSNLHYGLVPENVELTEWNYLVLGQKRIKRKLPTSLDFQGYWFVTIVRENFIPDELLFNVIKKVEEIPGLRLSGDEFEYEYTTKGNTNIVVEVLELHFSKTKKECG